LTILYGFIITRVFNFDLISSFFIAAALSFSSTIITHKLLTDKGDLNRLYGKISIGFLLVQDLFASLLLILVSSFTNAGSTSVITALVLLFGKGIGIILFLIIFSKFIMPRLSRVFASSQELLFLFSLSWGLGLASLFYTIGFSIEIGALAAGVTLSLTPFAAEIASRLKPLRDFFIVLFFIFLGAQMELTSIKTIIAPSIILSLFVLFGKPLIVFMLMNLLKHKRRTAYLTAVSLGQISEFSFILLSLVFTLGYISKDALSIITLISLISITFSTYTFLNADKIYPRISEYLRFFEFRKKPPRETESRSEIYDIVLFGFDKAGKDFISVFNKLNKKYIVIDFSPSSC
jgi:Kef-type K+ transport system membrane component KefB